MDHITDLNLEWLERKSDDQSAFRCNLTSPD
jgi:hypothetical protein